jgi:diaminopropionate ammonia-lyase
VMQLLARPPGQDAAIVAGESAVAGLAAAIGIARDPQARVAFGLDAESRILFFGSEADTDPALYRQLVGASAADVLGTQA